MTTDALRQRKLALRGEARQIRDGLDPAWRAEASAAIRAGILALPEVAAPETRAVALFASFGSEIETFPLLETLIERQGGVLLPRVVKGESRLEFRRVTNLARGLVPAYQEILEPDPHAWPEVVEPLAMDLIVVPGLCYDRRGYRIGYGGGFYDRLLTQPRHCRAVGIIYGPLLRTEPLPTSPWDCAVDAILTESGLTLPAAPSEA